jgi:hypothetical protein
VFVFALQAVILLFHFKALLVIQRRLFLGLEPFDSLLLCFIFEEFHKLQVLLEPLLGGFVLLLLLLELDFLLNSFVLFNFLLVLFEKAMQFRIVSVGEQLGRSVATCICWQVLFLV